MTPPGLPTAVEVREVGPRDGLQSEAPLPVDARVALVDALSATGLPAIEIGAFVHPGRVPAMAGTAEIARRIERRPGTRYRALVPNVRGARDAIEAGVDELQVVCSVSATHNLRNLGMDVEASLAAAEAIRDEAGSAGVGLEMILGTSFGCPYEGPVDPAAVAGLARRLTGEGIAAISFADTIGTAVPTDVVALLAELDRAGISPSSVAFHFHDTRGTALANLVVATQHGVTRFDAAVGGLGGCPFAPGATGNVATEDVVHLLEGMGVDTGVDLAALLGVARDLEETTGSVLPGHVVRAGPRFAGASR